MNITKDRKETRRKLSPWEETPSVAHFDWVHRGPQLTLMFNHFYHIKKYVLILVLKLPFPYHIFYINLRALY